jgi:hypothetical protein
MQRYEKRFVNGGLCMKTFGAIALVASELAHPASGWAMPAAAREGLRITTRRPSRGDTKAFM